MASYRLSRSAYNDLEQLYEYGLLTFGMAQADTYFDGLLNRLEEIGQTPERYPRIDEIRSGYRRSVYGAHAVYFQVSKENVLIVRILGRQNPGSHL